MNVEEMKADVAWGQNPANWGNPVKVFLINTKNQEISEIEMGEFQPTSMVLGCTSEVMYARNGKLRFLVSDIWTDNGNAFTVEGESFDNNALLIGPYYQGEGKWRVTPCPLSLEEVKALVSFD